MKQTRHSDTQRREICGQARNDLVKSQQNRLRELVQWVGANNGFYRDLWKAAGIGPDGDFGSLPLTQKSQLAADESDRAGCARNLSFAPESYCRFHRTSGTTGRPMVVLDTQDDWQFWMEGWQFVLDAANISATDRVLMAFSFGPFVGFWSAFDAAVERGALVIPTGAMSSRARLDLIETSQPTALFCTPSYALHLAQLAREQSQSLVSCSIEKILVAGEPGGSLPEIRNRIESAYNAKVIDHAGATEVGPWGFADADGTGLFVNELLFYPEFLDPETDQWLEPNSDQTEGQLCQLVLTTLGRHGCPVIRYVTGDLVRPSWKKDCPFVFLDGGVLSRADDMMVIRGVNVFPSSIEQILRSIDGVQEFQLEARKKGEMDQLKIIVEDDSNDPAKVAKEIELRLGLRVEVELAEAGSLPRFEMKGKRFTDKR